MNHSRTILRDKWVISSIKTDKPVPIRGQPEKHGSSMKRERERRRPFWVHKICFSDNINVLGSFENGHRLNINGETIPLSLGSKSVKVKKIMVPGMVRSRQQTDDPTRIATRPGYKVTNRRRWRRIRWVVVVVVIVEVDLGVGLAGREQKRVGSTSRRKRRRRSEW